jgi:hypothetical protein
VNFTASVTDFSSSAPLELPLQYLAGETIHLQGIVYQEVNGHAYDLGIATVSARLVARNPTRKVVKRPTMAAPWNEVLCDTEGLRPGDYDLELWISRGDDVGAAVLPIEIRS